MAHQDHGHVFQGGPHHGSPGPWTRLSGPVEYYSIGEDVSVSNAIGDVPNEGMMEGCCDFNSILSTRLHPFCHLNEAHLLHSEDKYFLVLALTGWPAGQS